MSNKNRHKNKSKSVKSVNTLGDILKAQGVNLNELKNKLQNSEKKTYKKTI
tara:strand:+ start:936 stop:1088 length:153 start_codon:yes stop_codon:yes gene_type:complete